MKNLNNEIKLHSYFLSLSVHMPFTNDYFATQFIHKGQSLSNKQVFHCRGKEENGTNMINVNK